MKILNNEKSKASSKPGTLLTSEEATNPLLFNKEKEEKMKKALYLRFWVALVLTNIFTYILSMPSPQNIPEKQISVAKNERLLKLKINEMTNLVGSEEYVSLYAGATHITNKAKIVKKLNDEEVPIYLVKISISDLNRIAPYKALELDSYPVTDLPKSKGGAYEIEI